MMMENKRTLVFKVNRQKIEKNGDFSGLVKGTRDIYKHRFLTRPSGMVAKKQQFFL